MTPELLIALLAKENVAFIIRKDGWIELKPTETKDKLQTIPPYIIKK